MTQIVGRLRGSSGLLSGKLTAKLAAPIIDDTTDPPTIYLPQLETFNILNGVVDIELPQTETQNISYEFVFNLVTVQAQYFFANGDQYFGPTHQYTDSNWYTSAYHDDDSVRLSRTVVEVLVPIDTFQAIVPNIEQCKYSELIPTDFTTDRLPSGARQIANLIALDDSYKAVLGEAMLRYAGEFNATTWYQPRQWVTYDGSSWFSQYPQPHQGRVPVDGSAYWVPLAKRGADGTGTTGNDTPYNAAGWNNQSDAPSRNAVRDIIEQLARVSQLASYAPIDSPNFTGTATAQSPSPTSNSPEIATTEWAREVFAPLASPQFSGNPSMPTPNLSSYSDRGATTKWVADWVTQYVAAKLNRVVDLIASRTTNQTLTLENWTTVLWNTENYDPNAAYNPATGILTAPAQTWYALTATAFIEATGGTPTTMRGAIAVYVNGTETARFGDVVNGGTPLVLNGTAFFNVAAGNSISVAVFVALSGGGTGARIATTTMNRVVLERVNF